MQFKKKTFHILYMESKNYFLKETFWLSKATQIHPGHFGGAVSGRSGVRSLWQREVRIPT
jgi:hypothetical protein